MAVITLSQAMVCRVWGLGFGVWSQEVGTRGTRAKSVWLDSASRVWAAWASSAPSNAEVLSLTRLACRPSRGLLRPLLQPLQQVRRPDRLGGKPHVTPHASLVSPCRRGRAPASISVETAASACVVFSLFARLLPNLAGHLDPQDPKAQRKRRERAMP